MKNMKFEYLVVSIKGGLTGILNDDKKQSKQLNKYGADGWELSQISMGKKFMKYIFVKRVA